VTGRGCPSSSRWNENKKNTTGRYPPYRAQMTRTRRVKMRATTRGGGGTPLLIALKWKEHNKKEVCAPLLVVSKRKLEHDREGWRPLHRVEMARTRRGGIYPSLLHQKGSENTMGRGEIATMRQGGACRLLITLRERHRKGVLPSHALRAC